MNVQRGDVVLVDFPFSSGSGAKIRPAIVIQADLNNRRLINTIVAMITSTNTLAGSEPTQLLIDVSTPEGKQSGLLRNSAVKCENIFTIERQAVRRIIGHLGPGVLERLAGCLKASLGL